MTNINQVKLITIEAKKLMKKKCRDYTNSAILNPLVPHGEGSGFEDVKFINQFFADIQQEVMFFYFGDLLDEDEDDLDLNEYSAISSVHESLCDIANDYIQEVMEIVKAQTKQ
jgi:hypothetical protein